MKNQNIKSSVLDLCYRLSLFYCALALVLTNYSANANSSPNSNSYYQDAKEMVANINEETLTNYANNAKKLKANQQDAALLNPSFNDLAANPNLKQMFPTVDFDAVKNSTTNLNQLLIFVSSSMSPTSLRQFSLDAQNSGGVLVLRGLINDSFKDTVALIKNLNQKGTRAIIDPNAFRLFDIKQVPQIVVVADNNNCPGGRCDHTPFFDKIAGQVSLDYALEQIAKKGQWSQKEAARMLAYLRQIKSQKSTRGQSSNGY